MIEFGDTMVDTTISVYNTITTEMLPTPAKSHYTFNLRDLSKVFQGILMADAAKLTVSGWMTASVNSMYIFYSVFLISHSNDVDDDEMQRLIIQYEYFQTVADLLRVWYHESERVFADRLVNDEDRQWFASLLNAKMKKDFNIDCETVITSNPLLYCDFAGSNDSRNYGEVVDHSKVSILLFLCRKIEYNKKLLVINFNRKIESFF